MAADNAEAVLFVEPLCSRVKFPNAEPHYVASVFSGPIETVRPSTFGLRLYPGIVVVNRGGESSDWPCRGYAGFDGVDN